MQPKKWLHQKTTGTYALVIGQYKNGSQKVIASTDDRRPAIQSTLNWCPSPTSIDEHSVPEKIKTKIFRHFNR